MVIWKKLIEAFAMETPKHETQEVFVKMEGYKQEFIEFMAMFHC